MIRETHDRCKNYITIVYAYVLVYLLLVSLGAAFLPSIVHALNAIEKLLHSVWAPMVLMVVYAFSSIFFFNYVAFYDPQQQAMKHILSLLAMFMLAFMLTSLRESFTLKEVLRIVLFTFVIVIAISTFVYAFPQYIQSQFTWSLILLLIGLILIDIIFTFVLPVNSLWIRLLSLVFIGLFCYILMKRTKGLLEKKEACQPPFDYVGESMRIVIDIINIFLRLLRLLYGKRRR
jgi:FtsH-binding integral membrane protein